MNFFPKNGSHFLLDLVDPEMLLWNADLTGSLRENADKDGFFYFVIFRLLCHPDGGRITHGTRQRLTIYFMEFLV